MGEDIFERLNIANEELKRARGKVLDLKREIDKFSSYDILLIGDVLSLLMSSFEGVQYKCFKNNVLFNPFYSSFSFMIEPIINDTVYSSLVLEPNDDDVRYIKFVEASKSLFNEILEQRSLTCFLLPSKCGGSSRVSYVQDFIDYLFDDRVHNNVSIVDKEYLNRILISFLEISRDKQCLRQDKIRYEKERREQLKKEKIFKDSCLVDRKSMFNNICYIVNNYSDMRAFLDNEYDCGFSMVYQKLIIKYNDCLVHYKTLVDNVDCYPDEIFYVCANKDKNTNIKFYEIKYALDSVIEKNGMLKKYFDFIGSYFVEQKDPEKRVLDSDSIGTLMNLIDVFDKGKQKRLGVKY